MYIIVVKFIFVPKERKVNMNRIVSKFDYEMFNISNFGYIELINYWMKIRNKKFILEKAIEVVKDDKNNALSFSSPMICFMILRNPREVDENIYKRLVNAIIDNPELGKLVIFSLSFLSLCLSDSILELNDNQIDKLIKAINERYYPDDVGLVSIEYQRLENSGETLLQYTDDKVEIEIKDSDSNILGANEHFQLVPGNNSEEIQTLLEISKRRGFNPRLKQAIINKYNIYLKELKLLNENDPNIIRLIREKNRLVI